MYKLESLSENTLSYFLRNVSARHLIFPPLQSRPFPVFIRKMDRLNRRATLPPEKGPFLTRALPIFSAFPFCPPIWGNLLHFSSPPVARGPVLKGPSQRAQRGPPYLPNVFHFRSFTANFSQDPARLQLSPPPKLLGALLPPKLPGDPTSSRGNWTEIRRAMVRWGASHLEGRGTANSVPRLLPLTPSIAPPLSCDAPWSLPPPHHPKAGILCQQIPKIQCSHIFVF